jgi:hypothetical protein
MQVNNTNKVFVTLIIVILYFVTVFKSNHYVLVTKFHHQVACFCFAIVLVH